MSEYEWWVGSGMIRTKPNAYRKLVCETLGFRSAPKLKSAEARRLIAAEIGIAVLRHLTAGL